MLCTWRASSIDVAVDKTSDLSLIMLLAQRKYPHLPKIFTLTEWSQKKVKNDSVAVYILNTKEICLPTELLCAFPPKMRTRYDKIQSDENRRTFLLARVLLWGVLGRPEVFHQWLRRWSVDDSGKPHVPGVTGFSISHSGAHLAAGVGEGIGIDLEKVEDVSFEDYAAVLADEDLKRLRIASNPSAIFTEIWTSKEAVVKAAGVGICADFETLTQVTEEHREHYDYRGARWRIYRCPAPDNYRLSVALPSIRAESNQIPVFQINNDEIQTLLVEIRNHSLSKL